MLSLLSRCGRPHFLSHLFYQRNNPLCGMSVTASHELILKIDHLLSVKTLVDMMDGVKQLVLILYHRSRRQFKVIIVESTPVAVIFIIISIKNHRLFKERVFEDQGRIVGDTDIRAADQIFDGQLLRQISGEGMKLFRDLRRTFDKRVMLADDHILIAQFLRKPVEVDFIRRGGGSHMSAEGWRVKNHLFASGLRHDFIKLFSAAVYK